MFDFGGQQSISDMHNTASPRPDQDPHDQCWNKPHNTLARQQLVLLCSFNSPHVRDAMVEARCNEKNIV